MAYNNQANLVLNQLKTLDEINTLNDIEKKKLEQILREFSVYGKSDTFNDLRWQDYEEIPVDVETFLKDPRYLGKGLIDEEGRFTVFPYWVDTMKKIFPDNLTTRYNTVILTGAIGIGKSFFADLCILYQLHRLLCLKDPYLYYGLQPIDKITVSLINITLDAARGVAWDKLQQLIQTSEWFLSHGTLKGKSNIEYIPDKRIELIVGSKNNHIIGRAVFASFEDEVNFSGVTTDIEKIKEKALKLITQVDARMQSRFMRGDQPLPTLNIIASSKDSEQSFLETYIDMKKNNESKTTLIIDEPQWVIRTDKDSPRKFNVAVGNKFLASELIPLNASEEEILDYTRRGFKILKVPFGYYENFRDNIDIALTDIAGISTTNALKYISGVKWNEIKDKTLLNPFSKDIIEVGNAKEDTAQYSDYFDVSKIPSKLRSKPLYIHLDMSISGDKTGIAGVWITGKFRGQDNSSASSELHYQLAFSISIKAPKGHQISFEKNRIFIRWLREQGLNIQGISSDTFQSAHIQQQLSADGFNTSIISVDRVDTQSKICIPYQYLKSSIYERKLKIYDYCPLLTEEIIGLERLSNGKVEHPNAGHSGSKDIADALCGALYNASQHGDEFAYDYGEDIETTVELAKESTSYQAYKEQVQIDLENQLHNMFNPIIPIINEQGQKEVPTTQGQEISKSSPDLIKVNPPSFLINERAEKAIVIQGDMLIW